MAEIVPLILDSIKGFKELRGRLGVRRLACEPEVSTAWRLQSLKGFFLHCQIGGYVDVHRPDILVAEPHRDSGDVHAGLQQVHGGGVAKMGSSPFQA